MLLHVVTGIRVPLISRFDDQQLMFMFNNFRFYQVPFIGTFICIVNVTLVSSKNLNRINYFIRYHQITNKNSVDL